MMTTRDKAVEIISGLPPEADVTDIMEELYLQLKIERGTRQLDNGEGVDHAEVEKRFQKCRA